MASGDAEVAGYGIELSDVEGNLAAQTARDGRLRHPDGGGEIRLRDLVPRDLGSDRCGYALGCGGFHTGMVYSLTGYTSSMVLCCVPTTPTVQRVEHALRGRTGTMERHEAATRVAEEVRALAARRQYSQTRIAHVLGCSQAAVSRMMRGEVPFDVVELDALAAEWDVPITAFFGNLGTSTTRQYLSGSDVLAHAA